MEIKIFAQIEVPIDERFSRTDSVTITLGDEAITAIVNAIAAQQSVQADIAQLASVNKSLSKKLQVADNVFAPAAPPESCEHGNLRGKCPVEICSYSKHGGRR